MKKYIKIISLVFLFILASFVSIYAANHTAISNVTKNRQ